MTLATMNGQQVHVDDEGFMTEYDEWNEKLATTLAHNIGIKLTPEHLAAIRFVRADYKAQGETPTLRRVTTVGGIPTKALFSSSRRSRPRRWPTSPVYPNQLAVSDQPVRKETS